MALRSPLPHRRQALGDLVAGYVFNVGGDGPLVAVGVGDASEAVAVELVREMDPGRVRRFTIES